MIRHALLVAWRHIVKSRSHTVINVIGFSIGMACCLVILLYVRDELSYDRHHSRGDRIYRIVTDRAARTPGPLASLIKSQLPGVEEVLRLRGTVGTWLFETGNRQYYEQQVYWADGNLFEVFDVPLVRGSPSNALTAPHSMVISESMGHKYFGSSDPMGQVITGDSIFPFTVTGIMKDPPAYAHYHADFYVSLATVHVFEDPTQVLSSWSISQVHTYMLLPEERSAAEVSAAIQDMLGEHLDAETRSLAFTRTYSLQPLFDIHLYSNLEHELESNGDVAFIWMLMAIAVLILLIACMNFTNLAVVRSLIRAREIGVRKVAGATRGQIIGHSLGETLLFCGIAFLVALGVSVAVLPAFRAVTGYALSMPSLEPWSIVGGIGIVLVVSILAGGYPAWVLSRLRPVTVFMGSTPKVGVAMLRKILVIAQFAIAIILMISTGVVYQQLDFISGRHLGFEKEHVVIFPFVDGMDRGLIYDQFPNQAGVVSVTYANYLPGRAAGRGILPLLPVRRDDAPGHPEVTMQVVTNWGNYVPALGLELVNGRDLTFERDTKRVPRPDGGSDFVATGAQLNEEAVRRLGWTSADEALNQFVRMGDQQIRVAGVIRDFHMNTLHDKIEPLLVTLGRGAIFAIRVLPGDPAATLRDLEALWSASTPNIPFTYSFLEDDVGRMYRSDRLLGQLVSFFAALAVFTACLGLYGLSVYTARQRTNEIGVRKVLGASASQLVMLLSKEFAFLVLIANVIAWPVAYMVMNRWLQDFAYHTEVGSSVFVVAGLAGLLIACVTVSAQTVRAASMNPVESLRPGH